MAANHLGLVKEARNGLARQDNWIAATGKTFDYRIKLAAYDASNVVDTAFTGTVTATVTSGTCTLGGTVSRACVAGVVDFSDLTPATGTGALVITFATGGLMSYVTASMTVVTPQYDAHALARHGVQAELPRLQVDSTIPTVFARTISVGPTQSVVAGVSYQTVQAAIDYCTANDIAGHTKLLVDVATYAATVVLRARAAGKGSIVLTPAVVPLAPGVRATPATLAATVAAMPRISVEAVGGMVTCENNAYGYLWVGIDFAVPVPALGTVTEILAALYIAVSSPTSLSSFPHHVGFDRCTFRAIDQVNTRLRKVVTQECPYFFMESCYVADAHDYPDVDTAHHGNGNGDTNAWNTTSFAGGPGKVNNTYFSGAGEVILVGGADPQFYDTKFRDVTFTHNLLYKDPAWMGVYPAKNNFEHKSSARWLMEGCIFDGSWEAGQDGTGITIGSANQSGTVDTNWEGIRDFVFRRNFCRNMTHWAVFNGINYFNAEILNGIAVYDNVAVNIHPAGYGEDSSFLMATGTGVNRFVFEQNTVLSPEARNTMAIKVVASTPNPDTYLRRNIMACGSLGIYVEATGAGTAGTDVGFPDDDLRENVFIAKVGSAAFGGAGFPPLSYYPATYAEVGFVDLAGAVAIWDVGDPDTICAKLTLAATSPYKAITSDATDPGANMTAIRTAIAGVWSGGSTGSAPSIAIAITTQPAGALSGVALTTQPAGVLQDAAGATVTSETSTVTAALIVTLGTAHAIGGITAVAIAGAWAFATLGAISTDGAVAFWRFTTGSLTIDSAPFSIAPRLRGRRVRV